MIKVSVIIATKNEAKNIKRLFLNLKRQTFKNFEVIIVDNYSTDKTLKIAKRFTQKVFTIGPERSTQRNFGAKHAKGKFLLFLDADMVLEKNVLAECYQALENKIGISAVVINEESKGLNFLSKIKALEKKIYQGQNFIEAPRFFRKRDFQKIGMFDEELISGEDWDLAERIKKAGKIVRINARIIHRESGSIINDLKKKLYYAHHIAKYFQKYPNPYEKQSLVLARARILFKKPNLIAKYPLTFLALLALKSLQYLMYVFASVKPGSGSKKK